MASLKYVVHKHRMKQDGTFSVYIRLSHQRKLKYIHTGKVATSDDLTKTFNFRNGTLKESLDDLILSYRKKLNSMPNLTNMSIEEVEHYLIDDFDITRPCIYKYANEFIDNLKAKGKKGTANQYQYTINSLKKFWPLKELYFEKIDVIFLKKYELFVRNSIKTKNGKEPRAPSLYISNIRSLFNSAKKELNKPQLGIMPIKYDPFEYYDVPEYANQDKRSISTEKIRAIYNLADKGTRYNLSRDTFILSFCLIGMNSADLYNCNEISDNIITYYRAKTKDRRTDKAVFKVRIEPEIADIVKKYLDPMKEKVFDFYKRYATKETFNQALNIGLKEVGKDIGEDDLEFYAARHSWATIASNDLLIDDFTVHKALNHIDEKMKITNTYIRKAWEKLWNANRDVLDYVFETDGSEKIRKMKEIDPGKYIINAIILCENETFVFNRIFETNTAYDAYLKALSEFSETYNDKSFPDPDSDQVSFLKIS